MRTLQGGHGMQPFYEMISDFIFVEDKPQRADVIFVPGGHYPDSAVKAAQLYLEGYAPYVLPSGKYAKPVGRFEGEEESEWAYLAGILREKGVDEAAILREDRATYTYENAIFSRRVIDEMHIQVNTALLVCQAFHARRALMYYQEQFPESSILVCPVETKGIRADNWFSDQTKTDIVLGEVERIGQQFHCMLPLHGERK